MILTYAIFKTNQEFLDFYNHKELRKITNALQATLIYQGTVKGDTGTLNEKMRIIRAFTKKANEIQELKFPDLEKMLAEE